MGEAVANPEIAKAVRILRGGGVIAFPTDTLYGLGADVFSTTAVNRVFAIKSRPAGMALPVLLGSMKDLRKVALTIPETGQELINAFWPGPLTLVLKRSTNLPPAVVGGGDTVAVRMPDHPIAMAIAKGLDGPITGTSANTSGDADLLTGEELDRTLGDKVDLVVKSGPTPMGSASTVVDLTGDTPTVLRVGKLELAMIQTVCKLAIAPPVQVSQ